MTRDGRAAMGARGTGPGFLLRGRVGQVLAFVIEVSDEHADLGRAAEILKEFNEEWNTGSEALHLALSEQGAPLNSWRPSMSTTGRR
ncbi:hypothetical protein HII36_25820 [Nonomuraea sp. NN258]|uniref:hypothetical protein n=1 Tax=Nonomuraea antri TaxID=2730852 RepID=UPI0015698CE0|nr:hypothetical protein [Nonomuraea antri]NRQ35217.1 hypothetical protein [Nonomuraea antri]